MFSLIFSEEGEDVCRFLWQIGLRMMNCFFHLCHNVISYITVYRKGNLIIQTDRYVWHTVISSLSTVSFGYVPCSFEFGLALTLFDFLRNIIACVFSVPLLKYFGKHINLIWFHFFIVNKFPFTSMLALNFCLFFKVSHTFRNTIIIFDTCINNILIDTIPTRLKSNVTGTKIPCVLCTCFTLVSPSLIALKHVYIEHDRWDTVDILMLLSVWRSHKLLTK